MMQETPPHWLFAELPSPRLSYIVQTVLGAHWQVVHDMQTFIQAEGVKLNYSAITISTTCWQITPHSLLFEKGIHAQQIVLEEKQGLPVFFGNDDALGFDVLAASFYLLARYEEYLPFTEDAFGRFPVQESLAYRGNFLLLPLIQLWQQQLKERLQQLFPEVVFPPQHFQFIPSFDIDIAYKYHYRGLWHNLSVFFKSLLIGQWEDFIEAANVLAGKQRDPFDVFPQLLATLQEKQLPAQFFFLVALHNKGVDKNINPYVKGMQQLIHHISTLHQTGIHLSVQSHHAHVLNNAEAELDILTRITQKNIQANRFHYLHFQLPQQYEQLLALGITADYSMGYSTVNGFRASYANPFLWYNLLQEKITNLTVYPFCWMDTACIFQQKLSPENAYTQLQQLVHITQQVGGYCTPVWHNHCLSTEKKHLPWLMAFSNFMAQQQLT